MKLFRTPEEIQILEANLLDPAKNFRSKLTSMNQHLKALLEKKLRIEAEILLLRKTIKRREKEFKLNIKLKGKIDPVNENLEFSKESFEDLLELDPILEEIDHLLRESEEILQESFETSKEFRERI